MTNEQIVSKIDDLMRAKKMSVGDLAKKTGLTDNALYNWKKRGSGPSVKTLGLICEEFGLTLAEFFDKGQENSTLQTKKLCKNFLKLTALQQGIIEQLVDEFLKKN